MSKEKALRNDLELDAVQQQLDVEPDQQETSPTRESKTWQERDAAKQDGDDDVIKVDSADVFTPNERSAGILSRMTSADAQSARQELRTAKKFEGRIEKEFRNFCTAYGLTETRAARQQFVAFLGQAGLKGKRAIHTVEESNNAAKAVFFGQVAAKAKITMETVGVRDVLDPRIALTDEERQKLGGITLDGKNLLKEREDAEKAWETKQYDTVIDAKAIYATGSPHLASFQMAARNAGYTDAEIAMATAGRDNQWLWHYTVKSVTGKRDELVPMPPTYKEFVAKYGANPLQKDRLDCNVLEDARMAIAAGQTLAQFYADPQRGAAYFEAQQREVRGPDVLPDLTRLRPDPIGTCVAGSATLGAASVGYIHCFTNGKNYISAGFTSAMGIQLSGQVLRVYGVEGATLDDVITGPSGGSEISVGEVGSVGFTFMGNHSGIVKGAGVGVGFTIPAGVTFSETTDLKTGEIPLLSSSFKGVKEGFDEIAFGGNGRGQVEDTLQQWPADNRHGHGLYNFLEGKSGDNLRSFTNKLPTPLENLWNASKEKQAIEDLVEQHGGVEAVERSKRWAELVPDMKALAMRFFDREVRHWSP